MRRRIELIKAAWEARKVCHWCKGSKVFHPHLPMACPVCDGTGIKKQYR